MRKKDKLYTIKQPINLYANGSFLDIISKILYLLFILFQMLSNIIL